jgi:hypothetical protein
VCVLFFLITGKGEPASLAFSDFSFLEDTMFSQWLENLKMLVGDVNDLPSMTELKRLFEGGYSELDAWACWTGEMVACDD